MLREQALQNRRFARARGPGDDDGTVLLGSCTALSVTLVSPFDYDREANKLALRRKGNDTPVGAIVIERRG